MRDCSLLRRLKQNQSVHSGVSAVEGVLMYVLKSMKYVTGFEKTLHMGFFLKIEFDAWLISSTVELTCVQVLG